MTNYFVEIPGYLSLEKQSQAIFGEEAAAAKFVNSKIWTNNSNKLSNLAEFEPIYTAPKTPIGKPKLSPTLPPGVQPSWVGQLVVDGKAETQIFLIRE